MNADLNVVVFWMVATRISGFVMLAPGIQDLKVPMLVRGAAVIWLSCFMTPLVAATATKIDLFWGNLLSCLVAEFIFGMGLGLVTRLVITSLQVGGTIMDNDLGLSAAQQLSPNVGISGGVMGRILMVIGLAIFWDSDYLSVLLLGIQRSFQVLPLGQALITQASLDHMVQVGAEIFAAGLIIAAPIAILSFVATLALGFVSRAVQHLNVFNESFTLRVAIGGGGVILFLPLILGLCRFGMERLIPAASEYFRSMT